MFYSQEEIFKRNKRKLIIIMIFKIIFLRLIPIAIIGYCIYFAITEPEAIGSFITNYKESFNKGLQK
jgi:flagellar basal body-associated protein FliL